ncbi:MAG: hypothetical protein JXR67_10490 [Bacteroidales bacterium]|nr:hypothetical protein [Bacteroidales bacterium]
MAYLKKTLFFQLLLTMLAAGSCSRENDDVIPDVYVDFTIDLMDPQFSSLLVIGVSDTVDSSTNNWGFRSAGYDDNGIIIYSGPDDYNAYDRTCPHDFAVNGLSVKIKTDMASIAECPECGTRYALSAYGTPISGPGKYPLKNYATSFDQNRYIEVWNGRKK